MSVPKIKERYTAKLLTAGWSPRTDRFYPQSALRKIQDQFTPPSLGDFVFSGDAMDLRLNLSNVSHRTNRVYLNADETELWAEVDLLDTRCGILVRDLYKKGNIRFDCVLTGILNSQNEVLPESVQFIRVSAYGVY